MALLCKLSVDAGPGVLVYFVPWNGIRAGLCLTLFTVGISGTDIRLRRNNMAWGGRRGERYLDLN